jgi:hypothetical protein
VAARGGRDGVLACLLTPVVLGRDPLPRAGVAERPQRRTTGCRWSAVVVADPEGNESRATSSASYPEEVSRRQDATTSPPVTG